MMKILTKIWDLLLLFFAFSPSKHSEKWEPEKDERSRTMVKKKEQE